MNLKHSIGICFALENIIRIDEHLTARAVPGCASRWVAYSPGGRPSAKLLSGRSASERKRERGLSFHAGRYATGLYAAFFKMTLSVMGDDFDQNGRNSTHMKPNHCGFAKKREQRLPDVRLGTKGGGLRMSHERNANV